jgi:hypothetical protein
VLRDRRQGGDDADRPGGGRDGNLGRILIPDEVSIDFLGIPRARVRPMPRFLRIVTGDAKAVTNGPHAAHAAARWTCSGTPHRASSEHYPRCPAGQLVQRIAEYPSCWNGTDTDSDTHRTHVTFPDQQRKAVTDHFDFENLMPESLMGLVVDCINTARTC